MPKRKQQTLRIIGGYLRGRKIQFPNVENLRPTSDRIRETLFNWLRQDIQQATCLDLFAGSGALGIEALSRQAKFCYFLEKAPPALACIQATLQTLCLSNAKLIANTFPCQLPIKTQSIDIVFLDPPYKEQLISTCIDYLIEGNYLAAKAKIYVEMPLAQAFIDLPRTLELIKKGKAGNVGFYLYEFIR